MKGLNVKRSQFLAAAVAVAAAAVATVFAAGRGDDNSAKCYRIDDGNYICKATGEVMETPCCESPGKSCCEK